MSYTRPLCIVAGSALSFVSTSVLSADRPRPSPAESAQKMQRLVCNEKDWLGFSEEGLLVCHLSVSTNGTGCWIEQNLTALRKPPRIHRVEDVRFAAGSLSFDLLEPSSTNLQADCSGQLLGFLLEITLQSPSDDWRETVKLTGMTDVRDILQAARSQEAAGKTGGRELSSRKQQQLSPDSDRKPER
jgi:hypothetical protein